MGGRLAHVICTSALGIVFLGIPMIGPASASENLQVEFDGAIVDMGEIRGATFDGETVPVATLRMSNANGTLSGSAEGFFTRDWYSGTASPSNIGMRLEPSDHLHGAFDSGTGSLSFSTSFRIEIFRFPDGISGERETCVTEPFPVTFATSGDSGYRDMPAPFVGGTEGPGSVWGSWDSLPRLVGDSWCESDSFQEAVGVGGNGGIMLTRARQLGIPDPPPDDPPGWSPVDPAPRTEPDLKLRLMAIRVNSGRGTRRVLVKVSNRGDGNAKAVRLCAFARPHRVRINRKCFTWPTLRGGSQRIAVIRLKTKNLGIRRLKLELLLRMSGEKVAGESRKLRAR